MDKVWTVEETAEALKAHPEHIRRMIREGHIRAIRLGTGPRSAYRVPNDELERFISEGPYVGSEIGTAKSASE